MPDLVEVGKTGGIPALLVLPEGGTAAIGLAQGIGGEIETVTGIETGTEGRTGTGTDGTETETETDIGTGGITEIERGNEEIGTGPLPAGNGHAQGPGPRHLCDVQGQRRGMCYRVSPPEAN